MLPAAMAALLLYCTGCNRCKNCYVTHDYYINGTYIRTDTQSQYRFCGADAKDVENREETFLSDSTQLVLTKYRGCISD